MAIYHQCRMCGGEHPHSVMISKETFALLQSQSSIAWLQSWVRCPEKDQVLPIKSHDLLWKD